MKKITFLILIMMVAASCKSDTDNLCATYACEMANGDFGATLHFKDGGNVFLDLVPNDLVERNPSLGNKLNVAGTYEVVDDRIVIKYFDGYQTHTLNKVDDKLTSTSDIFKLCSCKTE